MYKYKIKTSFVRPEMPKARVIKTGFNIMIVNIYIRRKLDIIRYKHHFSLLLRTSSKTAKINRFRSHTGNDYTPFSCLSFPLNCASTLFCNNKKKQYNMYVHCIYC